MAGHSQYKNIMFRKGKQDKLRSKIFSKLAREITVAAKAGVPDPAANARLRLAIQNARAENLPKDNIERAIKKAAGSDESNFDNVRYEGYGPGGVAIIVEALTDNRNRTASNVRSSFTKMGGHLGETNSVSFMFAHVGEVTYPLAKASADAMMNAAIEAGADDVAAALAAIFGEAQSVKMIWKPNVMAPVDFEKAETLIKLVELLDEDDDVQVVFSNVDIPDDVMAKLYPDSEN